MNRLKYLKIKLFFYQLPHLIKRRKRILTSIFGYFFVIFSVLFIWFYFFSYENYSDMMQRVIIQHTSK